MFTKKTVDSVVKSFNKAIKDLDTIVSDGENQANVIENEIVHMKEVMGVALQEASRARTISANIKTLMGE